MSICRCTWVYLSVSPTYYFTPCLLHLRYIKRTKERKKIKLTESVVIILSRSGLLAAQARDHTVDVVKYDKRRSKDRTVKVLLHQGQSIVTPQSQRVLLDVLESVTETNIIYHPFLVVKPSGCFIEFVLSARAYSCTCLHKWVHVNTVCWNVRQSNDRKGSSKRCHVSLFFQFRLVNIKTELFICLQDLSVCVSCNVCGAFF